MKKQFTPGPWETDGTDIRTFKTGKTIACIEPGQRNNADLIAAAPDLLEFLQGFVAKARRGEPIHFTDAFVVCAMKAIAKATGEA